ncbi:FAD-dependent oxidoreductase [Xanthobacteraceae bacterium Astr-EGSB]|uniref:FAD-dependent oxidoreductase n=1 Tax=Astrobacterium formosum TaxID=3069710 RepID=UPI0027AF3104|nr:FAD-dependent oxidoreductase [Xanthobacteraceae bacterium Astr-EGSB]
MSVDLVVVGAGGSGVSAARQAQMSGVKNVVLIEKQPAIGGTANFCEGMFAAESSLQSQVGIVVTREHAFRTIMEYSHWKANPRLVRAFIDKSAESIEWMKQNGVAFKYVAATTPGAPMTWHVFDGLCKKAVNTLAARFTENGGKILTKTPGKSLINEKGTVLGVTAEQDGAPLEIRAKAVIIATGGYANSKELMTKYTDYPDTIPIGNIGKDGDGIKMAWAAGAAKEGMGVLQTYRPGLPKYLANSHLMAAARQPYLWIDHNGFRFTDETIQSNWPFAGNALVKSGGTAISIFDADTRKFLETNGIEQPMGEYLHSGSKLMKFEEELQKEIATGNNKAFVANSLAELAQKIGVNPAVLEETITQNNTFAEQRADGQFFKSPKFLRPVKTPPFYAVKLHPTMLGTLGGVRVNEKLQAVGENGMPIPGLYVVGNDAGGMYGDTYDLLMSGSTMGFAVNSGRIAGENAAKYIGAAK